MSLAPTAATLERPLGSIGAAEPARWRPQAPRAIGPRADTRGTRVLDRKIDTTPPIGTMASATSPIAVRPGLCHQVDRSSEPERLQSSMSSRLVRSSSARSGEVLPVGSISARSMSSALPLGMTRRAAMISRGSSARAVVHAGSPARRIAAGALPIRNRERPSGH